MAVAGLLAQYMAVKNQLSYCQLQDTRWNDLATAMSKKLSQQENYQSKWDDSSAAFYDSWDDTKEFKANGIWSDGKSIPEFIDTVEDVKAREEKAKENKESK